MATRPAYILLVDPFHDESSMYAVYLRSLGFEMLVFADPHAAWREAVNRPPDLLLARLRQSDPSLDGVELIRRMKATDATRQVPTIILSTSIHPRDRQAAIEAGCDRYMLLPLLPDELLAELEPLIQRREITGPC
jgi:DNA-binding response OmpR family regulator